MIWVKSPALLNTEFSIGIKSTWCALEAIENTVEEGSIEVRRLGVGAKFARVGGVSGICGQCTLVALARRVDAGFFQIVVLVGGHHEHPIMDVRLLLVALLSREFASPTVKYIASYKKSRFSRGLRRCRNMENQAQR